MQSVKQYKIILHDFIQREIQMYQIAFWKNEGIKSNKHGGMFSIFQTPKKNLLGKHI